MQVHLVDATYELFRAYHALPPLHAPDGRPVGAVHGLIQSLLRLMREDGVTHIGCAFDTVITSFRNRLFPGYKTGDGTPPDLLAQFELAERAAAALGLCVWPMVEFEADDAIAAAATQLAADAAVERIIICSPDKDLAQLAQDGRIVCLDRRRGVVLDEAGVVAKYGVAPASIPDLLALTGDTADGIPGLPRWGAKTAAAVLSRYGRLEAIPIDAPWDGAAAAVRGAASLRQILRRESDNALLYRRLATLRRDAPVDAAAAALCWPGAGRAEYEALCGELGLNRLAGLPHRWRDEVGG